jgi:uncharacterized membrane protein YbhN (UPF0104 family)
MRKQHVTRATLAAVGVVASVLFGYLAVRGVDFSTAWRALEAMNAWWLVPSLAALAASVAVRVVRWHLLFQPGRRPPFAPLAKATLLGLFFNSILPARAGEAARILALKSYTGTSLAETTGTVVVERVADVTSLLLLLFQEPAERTKFFQNWAKDRINHHVVNGVYVLINLVVDVLYVVLDPRIRY